MVVDHHRLDRVREVLVLCDGLVRPLGYDNTHSDKSRDIRVHRVVLAAMAPCFRAKFHSSAGMEGAEDEKDDLPVLLSNYDWPTTSAVVRYAYTGKLELSSETVVPQLHAADFYQVDLATEAVLDFIVENMSADDCLVVHDAALPLQSGRGEMAARRALDFARAHFCLLYTSPSPRD